MIMVVTVTWIAKDTVVKISAFAQWAIAIGSLFKLFDSVHLP